MSIRRPGARIAIAALLIAGTGAALYLFRDARPAPVGDSAIEDAVAAWRTYRSQRFGVTFRYPPTYFLIERDVSTARRSRHSIVLMEDTRENRDLVEGRSRAPREGPPTINLDLFQNVDHDTAERWVRGSGDSHYSLSPDGELSSVTLAGEPAVAYRWDGLYQGRSVVVARADWIHMWSVAYLDLEDAVVGAFNHIMQTVKFD